MFMSNWFYKLIRRRFYVFAKLMEIERVFYLVK